jgi:hypothetical protein
MLGNRRVLVPKAKPASGVRAMIATLNLARLRQLQNVDVAILALPGAAQEHERSG